MTGPDVKERSVSRATQPAAASECGDRIFVRDFVVDCNVGVYAEEKGVTQKVSFTVEAQLSPSVESKNDDIAEVPSYADIIDAITELASGPHIELVETFAERIAERCLSDRRIIAIRIALEKLERGPKRGVEIIRPKSALAARCFGRG